MPGGSATVRISSKDVSFIPIVLYGVCSSVSGLAFVWNYGLVEGFRENLIVLSVAGLAATCVGLCLTELTSALPLSDGIYGLARSMLNPLAGYLVGFNEVLSQLVFVAHLAFLFGLCVTFMIDGDSRVMDGSDYMNGTSAALFQPMMWLLFVLIILVPALQYQHHLLWRAIIAYGVLCVLLLLVYILGSSASARVDRFPFWSGDERGLGPLFPSSAGGFFAILPYALWVFRGVDVLTLTCSITSKPRKSIPIAIVAMHLALVAAIFLISFVGSAQLPGVEHLSTSVFPLLRGYSRMFSIPQRAAAAFIIPLLFSSAQARLYAAAQTMRCMAAARLLPDFLERWDREMLARLTSSSSSSSSMPVERSLSAGSSRFSHDSGFLYHRGKVPLLGRLTRYFRTHKSVRVAPLSALRPDSSRKYVNEGHEAVADGERRNGSGQFDHIEFSVGSVQGKVANIGTDGRSKTAAVEALESAGSPMYGAHRENNESAQSATAAQQNSPNHSSGSPQLIRRHSSADLTLSVLPRVGMLVAAVFVFLFLIIIYFGALFGQWNTLLIMNTAVAALFMCNLLTQLSILSSFVLFRWQFQYYVARRKFYNAWGVGSAVFSALVICAAIFGMVAYPLTEMRGVHSGSMQGLYALITCVVINMLAAAVYTLFLRDVQTYSAVEETVRAYRGKKENKSARERQGGGLRTRDFPIITNKPSSPAGVVPTASAGGSLFVRPDDFDECTTEDDTNKVKSAEMNREGSLSRRLFISLARSILPRQSSLRSNSSNETSSRKTFTPTVSNYQLPGGNWDTEKNDETAGEDGSHERDKGADVHSDEARVRSSSEEEDKEWEDLMRLYELQPSQNRLAHLTPAQQREIMQLSRAMVEDDTLLTPIREGEYEDRSELSFGSRLTGRRIYRDHSMSIMSDVSLMS